METPNVDTKTDRELQARIEAVSGDAQRVEVIECARAFKRSWIELAEALARVSDKELWQRWGYKSFEAYCKSELRLTSSTALKLLGSFRFLRQAEPKIIERVRRDPNAAIPSLKAVDFVARATERGAADDDVLEEIKKAAFEEGAEAPALTRRFKTVAFPMEKRVDGNRSRAQLLATARRLAQLVAEADDDAIPNDVAIAVEGRSGALSPVSMKSTLELHEH
jgi:hypothetical protein